MKVKVWVETNIVGSRVEEEFEIADEATNEQIEEAAKETMYQMYEWGYKTYADGEDTDDES